jgi:5-methylcytosine-specific restriction endonuclease McrA
MFNLFSSTFGSRSSQWKTVRKNHLQAQPVCQACNRKENLEVHHIKPFHIFPDLELDPTNLITLCKTCHLVFGHLMDYKSWNDNVTEDVKNFNLKVQERPYHETLYKSNIGGNNWINTIWNFFGWN